MLADGRNSFIPVCVNRFVVNMGVSCVLPRKTNGFIFVLWPINEMLQHMDAEKMACVKFVQKRTKKKQNKKDCLGINLCSVYSIYNKILLCKSCFHSIIAILEKNNFTDKDAENVA